MDPGVRNHEDKRTVSCGADMAVVAKGLEDIEIRWGLGCICTDRVGDEGDEGRGTIPSRGGFYTASGAGPRAPRVAKLSRED